MRASDIERAILTGRYPNRTEETKHMPSQIEMEAMRAQIAQARTIHEHLPKIAAALEAMSAHLETIAVTAEALLDDNFTTVDEHFESVIEMQTGITEDGVGRE